MKSWKIGAASGLIAGIAAGIVHAILVNISLSLGFWSTYWRSILPITIDVLIIINIVWGIVLGLIYSKIYRVISGKGISKGLVYGLTLYLIVTIRMNTFGLAYGFFQDSISEIIFNPFRWIAYGLVIGFLYEFLSVRYYISEKKPKIIVYDMMSGVIPGTIAGLISGAVSVFFTIIGPATELFDIPRAPTETTLDFLISLAGSELFINMLWGAVFGAIFAKVYNTVPKKGILKGLIYGSIVFLITSFKNGTLFISMGIVGSTPTSIHFGLWNILVGFFLFIAYGLAIGYLYKPIK